MEGGVMETLFPAREEIVTKQIVSNQVIGRPALSVLKCSPHRERVRTKSSAGSAIFSSLPTKNAMIPPTPAEIPCLD